MLLHVTIYLKRRHDRVAFVHRDVLIYHIIGKEKVQEKQPKDLLAFCVEKSKEFVSFKCTCQVHELLSTTESLPITILLQEVNLPINGGRLMQSLTWYKGTKFQNYGIYQKFHVTSVMQCNKKWKVIQFQFKSRLYSHEKSAKTLAVGEIQSSPVSQMTAVGIMANESPKMLLGITMNDKEISMQSLHCFIKRWI